MRLRRFGVVWIVSLGLGVVAAQAQIGAAKWSTTECHGDSDGGSHSWGWGSSEHVCELRETTLPASAQIDVEGTNGAIEMVGEDRTNVALEVRVTASGSSKADADELEHKVKVLTKGVGGDDLKISDDGPRLTSWFSNQGYSVSYRLLVPKTTSGHLQTVNGAVSLKHVSGTLHLEAVNGSLKLTEVSGDVHAETVNGRIEVALDGARWLGSGLHAETTNGGIQLTAPEHYSAHLVVSTVNGGIHVGFPVTVDGDIRHSLDTNIGQGGPTIHLETVNGGVSVGH